MRIESEKLKCSEKNLSHCHLTPKNQTRTALGVNTGLRVEKPVANRLNYKMTTHIAFAPSLFEIH